MSPAQQASRSVAPAAGQTRNQPDGHRREPHLSTHVAPDPLQRACALADSPLLGAGLTDMHCVACLELIVPAPSLSLRWLSNDAELKARTAEYR